MAKTKEIPITCKPAVKKHCRRCPGGLLLTKCVHSKEYRTSQVSKVKQPEDTDSEAPENPPVVSTAGSASNDSDPFLPPAASLLRTPGGAVSPVTVRMSSSALSDY